MKRHAKKRGMAIVLSLIFALGGLLLVNDVQAQQPTVVQVQPQQSWISTGAALPLVGAKALQLSNQYQQLKQAGAEPAELQKVKIELNLYMMIQKALEHGFSTKEAFEKAWEATGLGIDADAATIHIMSPIDAKAIHDKAIDLLTD